MFSDLPLDDQIGKTFYIDGATWRLVYTPTIGRFALKRIAATMSLHRAVELIAAGELLWNPLEYFESLSSDTTTESVQRHVALLEAFLQSPFGRDMTDWSLRARLEARLTVYRTWLTRRALKAGDATDAAESGSSGD
jgi:hypothetical protein